ncbi:hypothetical protein WJX77_003024 [Trebouxia sp. C0004]
MASYTPRGCYVQKRSHQTAYTGIACPDKKGSQDGHCKRGDSCPYSHNTFEDWLHPTRYHTQLCQTGAQCSRPICFFAHRSSAQAGTVGVTADDQPQRNAFDEGRRSDDINRASQL